MRIATFIGCVVLVAPAGVTLAADAPSLDSETARVNYSLGFQIGGDFKRQGIELDRDTMVKGIEDAISGAEPLMKAEDMHSTLVELKRKIVAEQKKKAAELEAQIKEESKKFLEENAKQPGVVTTPSGLQYQIIEPGTGKTPGPSDQVTVHYRGTQVNGQEFDSSYSRGKPATFQLSSVIKGWTEGLQLIKEGGKIKLVIPAELAYGERGPLANRTLIFDVELVSVGPSAEKEPAEGGEAAHPKTDK